jgi:hypothetical protein
MGQRDMPVKASTRESGRSTAAWAGEGSTAEETGVEAVVAAGADFMGVSDDVTAEGDWQATDNDFEGETMGEEGGERLIVALTALELELSAGGRSEVGDWVQANDV